jgi:uncharacterized membrane protein YtjA (UPF0391 family)
MRYYVFLFMSAVVITAGLLGFGTVALAAAGVARFLLLAFVILFVANLISHWGRRESGLGVRR